MIVNIQHSINGTTAVYKIHQASQFVAHLYLKLNLPHIYNIIFHYSCLIFKTLNIFFKYTIVYL